MESLTTPGTPGRSRALSPASTSANSPVGKAMSYGILTPKSKVRALLAAIDDSDSDVELQSGNALRRPKTGSAVESEKENCAPDAGASDKEDEDMEEEEVFKPRGRHAARMMAPIANADNCAKETRAALNGRKPAAEAELSPVQEESNPVAHVDKEERAAIPSSRRKRLGKVRSTPVSSPTSARNSPGLFLSPAPPTVNGSVHDFPARESDSDADLPENLHTSSKFQALVQRKRQEYLAKEAAIAEEKTRKHAERQKLAAAHRGAIESGEESDINGKEAEQKLTRHARPTRKAGKKALEEMARETQRMSRNMQLSYEAKTRKKISKDSLFKRFNFRPAGFVEQAEKESTGQDDSSGSRSSDAEPHSTPPTSPMVAKSPKNRSMAVLEKTSLEAPFQRVRAQSAMEDGDLPTFESLMSDPIIIDDSTKDIAAVASRIQTPKRDKGKGRAIEILSEPEKDILLNRNKKPMRQIRVHPPVPNYTAGANAVDSDSELEIVAAPKQQKTSIFDRQRVEKSTLSNSFRTLRALANLGSPGKQRSNDPRCKLTPAELQESLRRRAREQAAKEREEKIQELRSRGVTVLTKEEREKEQAEAEDLVAKARQEAFDIMQREKQAAKKEKKASGRVDGLEIDDSTDDEEWQEENESAGSNIDSGEDGEDEEEEDDEEEEEEEEREEEPSGDDEDQEIPAGSFIGDIAESTTSPSLKLKSPDNLIENEASEDERSEEEISEGSITSDLEESFRRPRQRRRPMQVILSDDEDGEKEKKVLESPMILRSAKKPFIPGLPPSDDITLDLAEMFAATIAEDQSQYFQSLDISKKQESATTKPVSSIPETEPSNPPTFILDSQRVASQKSLDDDDNSADLLQIEPSNSQPRVDIDFETSTQMSDRRMSETPEPTQDPGFSKMTPVADRFAPPSTIATVLATDISPVILRKRGRLTLRKVMAPAFSDDEEDQGARAEDNDDEVPASAFDVMHKASKKRARFVDEFSKKLSEAKGMVEEQAEESEDEYAGLGGASGDDDSGKEDDGFLKEMINDRAQYIDESKLAAYNADKERKQDEQNIEKLFKGVTNGFLRRKRGADFDLSDSEDDGEARRRMKQREFEKMRKALFKDENVEKIATNPKKLAFLRSLEDRDAEDVLDFLDEPATQTPTSAESQEESQAGESLDADAAATTTPNPTKKKRTAAEAALPTTAPARLPPHLRRKPQSHSVRPHSLAEIRESLSLLIEEPSPADANAASSSDSDSNAPRSRTSTTTVINRITQARAQSLHDSRTPRPAFFHRASSSNSSSSHGARGSPALVRRATANHAAETTAALAATERAAGEVAEGAREAARRRKGETRETREMGKRRREAVGRREAVSGLLGGGGGFE
ncbi:MAG: hypothetical protein M1829_005562 [Trizodia sp. TS-e1964]|nr:MAG: hypothetical protein M1829_005562 [Trizodia sp. TS-e1964]